MHFSNEQWQQCIFSGIIYFSYLSSISIFQYSSKMLRLLRFPLFIKICQNPSISRRIYPTLRSRRQWGWMLYYDICIEESYSLSFILRHDCTKHRGFAPFLSWKETILNSLPTLEADSPFWMVCGREERERAWCISQFAWLSIQLLTLAAPIIQTCHGKMGQEGEREGWKKKRRE